MALTTKQQVFVQEYLIDLNATQAAIRAGYSQKTAEKIGFENLHKPEIEAAIAEALAAREKRTGVTQDRVIRELARIGFSDIRTLFDEGGNLRKMADLPDEVAAAVASVEVVTKSLGEGEVEYVHKIKLWDKPKALEMIGRHLKMFTDKIEVDASSGFAELLKRSRERARSRR